MSSYSGLYKILDKDARASDEDKLQYPVPHGKRAGAWMPPVAAPKAGSRGYHLTTDPLAEAQGRGLSRIFLAEYKGKIDVASSRIACESVRLVREITPDWELLPAHPEIRVLLVSEWHKEFGKEAALPEWADLTRAVLTGAYLSGAYLSGAYLSGAYLSGAYLSGADLSGAYLSEAYLTRADLSHADLSRADLTRADLSGAHLIRGHLTGADLSEADLTGAALTGAYLSGAYLTGADLFRADLSGADLSGAHLFRADLLGAYLFRADLSGAEITRAQLNTCRNVGDAKLDDAIVDGKTLNAGATRRMQAQFRKAAERGGA